MLAMKESLRESGQIVYSRCCVLDAPPDVPDGNYTVRFDGHSVSAIRQNGLWLPEDRVVQLPPQERLEPQEDVSFRIEDAIEILPLLKKQAA
jgi:hypothetical protein